MYWTDLYFKIKVLGNVIAWTVAIVLVILIYLDDRSSRKKTKK